MGSLSTAGLASEEIKFFAGNALAVILAMPMFGLLLRRAYPFVSGMSPAMAVVFFSVVGGASGIVSQVVAARQLEQVNRDINALELGPAIAGTIITAGIVTYALLEPEYNPMVTILDRAGQLPE